MEIHNTVAIDYSSSQTVIDRQMDEWIEWIVRKKSWTLGKYGINIIELAGFTLKSASFLGFTISYCNCICRLLILNDYITILSHSVTPILG